MLSDIIYGPLDFSQTLEEGENLVETLDWCSNFSVVTALTVPQLSLVRSPGVFLQPQHNNRSEA